jgi:bifunctional non-homologous end joining protein LigD
VLNYPDFMVFDLDPYLYSGEESPGGEPLLHTAGFERAREAAIWVREVLDSLGLQSFVKTSGKSGLHIVVPIRREFDYDAVRGMAQQICRFVLQRHPDALTMEWSVSRRTGKVFLDHNQNTRGKTLACVYSPRALPGAPISMPFAWDEIDSIYPTDYTIANAVQRIEQVGDLWQDILQAKNDLAAALAKV